MGLMPPGLSTVKPHVESPSNPSFESMVVAMPVVSSQATKPSGVAMYTVVPTAKISSTMLVGNPLAAVIESIQSA